MKGNALPLITISPCDFKEAFFFEGSDNWDMALEVVEGLELVSRKHVLELHIQN